MTKEKSRKTKVFLLTIFIILCLIVFSPVAIVVTGELWTLNTTTVVLDNTTHNVNIGKNETTIHQLEVNGNVYVNGTIDTNEGNSTTCFKIIQSWMDRWNTSSGGNPFDQELNTTDNVTHNDVTVTNDTTVRNIIYDDSSISLDIYAGKNHMHLFTGQIKPTLILYDTGEIDIPYQSSARAILMASQHVVPSTWTKLLLAREDYDLNNDFASYKFTAPKNGVYSIAYSVMIQDIQRGNYVASLIYTNGIASGGYENNYASATCDLYQSGADIQYLSTGDYLELYVFHNTVLISKTFPVQTYTNYMAICKIA